MGREGRGEERKGSGGRVVKAGKQKKVEMHMCSEVGGDNQF